MTPATRPCFQVWSTATAASSATAATAALDRAADYPGDELAAVVARRAQLAVGVTVVRDLGDRDWVAVAHRIVFPAA